MAANEQAKRLESQAYPAYHVGFLDHKQQESLDQFRRLCEEKGDWTPATATAPASHDDETLLRYLRARRWVPADAYKQFSDTEQWRKKNHIDKLYDQIDIHEFDVGAKLYPQWTGRRDKRGIPVYLFEIAHLTTKAVSAFESAKQKPGEVESDLPPRMLRLFALYEALTNFALPLCSMVADRTYPQTPVSQSSNIVDISNVSLKQFWNLKTHMQDASQLATAYYPETLDRIFIIGAPGFFPTVWGWIKRWFDPITVSKIFILSKAETLPTLSRFMDINDIPKKYGGNLDWNFGDPPDIDEKIHKTLTWINPEKHNGKNTFPVGPVRWRLGPDGKYTGIAVGSDNGKPRSIELATATMPPLAPSNSTPTAKAAGDPALLTRMPSAVDTHPPTPPPGEVDLSNPPSGSTTPARSVKGQAEGSQLGTPAALPLRTSSPAGTTSSVRQGTTATRYDQQASTHGHGQLKHDTPEVRETSEGDKHGVMEPNTVSQAPKEHPVPEVIEPAPGIVDQVKGAAGTAIGAATAAAASVAGLVGLGGASSPAESGDKPEEPSRDKAVDEAPPEKVEEFLRSKTGSTKDSNSATI